MVRIVNHFWIERARVSERGPESAEGNRAEDAAAAILDPHLRVQSGHQMVGPDGAVCVRGNSGKVVVQCQKA